jgi:hypothetical protein
MTWFHAEITTGGWGSGFLLDLDEVAVVQDLLIPIYNKDLLVLNGRQVSMAKLDRCKIVMTDLPVQPRFMEWLGRQIVKSSIPKTRFLEDTSFFDVERDVSNSLLHEFKRASDLTTVKELLGHERQLKETLAKQPSPEVAAQIKTELSNTSVKIAKVVGAFVGAAIDGWMSGQT